MKLDTVPIRYGLVDPKVWKRYDKASKKSFPNANTYYGGGCILEEASEAEVLYCPKCRVAEAKWKANHHM